MVGLPASQATEEEEKKQGGRRYLPTDYPN